VLAALSSGESEALFIGRAVAGVTRCVEWRRKLNEGAKNEERRRLSLIMGSHSGASWECRHTTVSGQKGAF
jgi:hypothetical protein